MLVCHCRVVSDRTIRSEIRAGAYDAADVSRRCGAGGGCGGCVPAIEQLLDDARLALQAPDVLTARQAHRRATLAPASAA